MARHQSKRGLSEDEEGDIDICGNRSFFGGPVDEHGKPVERTKWEWPYSYSGYVLWRQLPNSAATFTIYSDRLEQHDWDKTQKLWKEHCGCRYPEAGPERLTAFLRAWYDDPGLEIVLLMEYCNVSNGYPCWRIDIRSGKKNENDRT